MKCDGNLHGTRIKTLVLKNISQNSLELGGLGQRDNFRLFD